MARSSLTGRELSWIRRVLDRAVRDPLIDAARSSGHQTSYWMYVPEGEPTAAVMAGSRHSANRLVPRPTRREAW
jgi:hypothetical protein